MRFQMTDTRTKRLVLLVLLSVFTLLTWPSAHRTSAGAGPAAKRTHPADEVRVTQAHKQESDSGHLNAMKHTEELRVDPFPYLDLRTLESMEVVATGYSAGKESTGKSPGHPEYGITFSGVKVRRDAFSTIAADPRIFPLGTILFIPGYGFGVVADTGSAIKGKKLDLYFATKNQVYEQWGKKKVKVYILRKGDGKVTEAMLDRLNKLDKGIPVDKAL